MHQGLAAHCMRGHHHPGRLLMHLAQVSTMHQDPATPTTVLLMHQDLEGTAMETIPTVLQSLTRTRTRSQMEDALSVERKDISLVNVLTRLLLQLSPMQLR